jgi:hypothetical protein
MSRVENLVGVASNQVSWTNRDGLEHLNGRLRAPFIDNRNLLPSEQVWDLGLNMFEVSQVRLRSRVRGFKGSVCSSLGFGISAANRYSYNMRGQLRHIPNAIEFFDRIERILDSNDVLDIRDIRLLMDFVT